MENYRKLDLMMTCRLEIIRFFYQINVFVYNLAQFLDFHYLRQRGYVFVVVCLSVCLFVSNFVQKLPNGAMGGYSHLVPAGTFRVSFLVGFVCPCIMLCLWRVMHRLAARRLDHCVFTCRVRSARDTETSRDHLLDLTIEFARKFCARSRFLYKSFLRASAVVENRSLANCAVRHLSSNRAVDFCVYGVETI